jgi:hypothetical protein
MAIVLPVVLFGLAVAQRARNTPLDDAQIRTVLMRASHLLNSSPSLDLQRSRDAEAVVLLSLVVKQRLSDEAEKAKIVRIKHQIENHIGKPTSAMDRFVWRNTLYDLASAICP